MSGTAGVIAAVLLFGVPLVGFALWPLWGQAGRARTFLPVSPDPREPFLEQKRQVLGALRELDFEHESGHVSDEDYAELRTRYESEAARVLTELDRFGAPAARPPAAPRATTRSGWRHPFALGAGAVALVVFGVALGGGIARYSAPDPTAGLPMPGSRPLASLEPPAPGTAPGTTSTPRTLTPEMLRGMLQAARTSLFEGRYGEAIAAYQAVLKRDPKNVDALTHLALVAALAGHGDEALTTFDKALAIDPDYAPALLYKGQVLYDIKRDREGAIRTWERFLKVVPTGEDHERVKRLIAEARTKR
jgi:tetratricopeptide (TPR) repeat protein